MRGLPTVARAISRRRRSRAPRTPAGVFEGTSRPTKASASDTSCFRDERDPPVCSCTIATLSKTDSFLIACSCWNVLRTPHRERLKSAMRSRSSPNARTVPAAGDTNPLSTLKNVVFPAPFGPIRPQVPPGKTTVISSIGVTPPNRTVRPSTSIMPQAPRRRLSARSRA